MPYAHNGEVRINFEVAGRGEAPLLLIHGLSDSLESWREFGYVDAFSASHRIVLMDLRGHGASDKPVDPARYCFKDHVADVCAVLDALAIDRAHVFGVSLGARVGFGLAKHAPQRLRSLALCGAAPAASPGMRAQFTALLSQGPEAFVAVWEGQGRVSPALRARLLAIDTQSLTAMLHHEDDEADDLVDSLRGVQVPVRLFAGDLDWSYAAIAEFANGLPAGSLETLPGLNHFESFARCDVTAPLVATFLSGA